MSTIHDEFPFPPGMPIEEARRKAYESLFPDPLREGIKYDAEKPRLDLISPAFLNGIARVLTFGAKKYADHNWAKGLVYSRCYSALQRHLNAWHAGEDCDQETGENHLFHAACCLMFLAHFESYPQYRALDDRPAWEIMGDIHGN